MKIIALRVLTQPGVSGRACRSLILLTAWDIREMQRSRRSSP